ncbi:MAG TPA: L,D-transpeptidase family protein [Candidatus Competibacter sp.]|nr:L,D-transpeptidase family protein [Candidatus Competibacter sp.]
MPSPFLKRFHWLLAGMIASTAQATVYPLPPPDTDVIGEVKVVYATKEETLIDIARNHSLGYDEIVHANPGVDRWAPGEGTPIVLPTRYILPDTPREGVVLNIAEMRLYYYPTAGSGEERVVHTFPVSIGRMDWKTPMGLTKVVAKDVDPPWRPPATIKAEHAKEGDILPDVVPGGPDNPLGRFALRLGVPGYLIHGTNKPYGIGMRVTHGCVRMYPEDIERVFGMVPVGTPVRLIDQPVKVGRLNGELLVESHEPLEEDNLPMKVTLEQAQRAVIAKTGPDMPGVDQAALQAAVEQVSGIPVSVSAEPGSVPAGSMANPSPMAPSADYPTANRMPNPASAATPSQYAPSASAAPPSSAPSYPAAGRTPNSYPAPYSNSSVPPAASRPAPPAPSRYAPYGSPTADYDELPYRPAPGTPDRPAYRPAAPGAPVDTPAYRPAASGAPVDTPAYRPAPSAPPRYTRNLEDADYQEPPYVYPPGAARLPPVAVPPNYRSIPNNPDPYPGTTTPPTRPSMDDDDDEPADPLEPIPAKRS